MPVSSNFNAFLGAAVLGVISAAGLYVFEYYRQEKTRQKLYRDLARLDRELSQVKSELHELLAKQEKPKSKRIHKSILKKNSSNVSTTSDDYLSASNLDSSDLEFYDVSDNEDENDSIELGQKIEEIDRRLDCGNLTELEHTLIKLQELCIENPEDADLLYRLGKAHHKIIEFLDDKDMIQNHLARGIDACSQALRINPNNAEVHKWYAILVGGRSDFQSIQERISDGYLFKKHVDTALKLNPSDPVLHHMLGRFDFEAAALKWYERKAAAALFGEPPTATYDEAVGHFLEAEKLTDYDWKENRLLIAKCKIAQGQYKEAVEWLSKAARGRRDGMADDKMDAEIKALMEKYNGYR